MKTIADHKKESVLNTVINHDGDLITRKQWLENELKKGSKAIVKTVPKYKFSRAKYNRMTGLEQLEYDAKMKETKKAFELESFDGYYYDLNKTEYEYFMELQEDELICISCGKVLSDMDTNYGTVDFPQCIQCSNLN